MQRERPNADCNFCVLAVLPSPCHACPFLSPILWAFFPHVVPYQHPPTRGPFVLQMHPSGACSPQSQLSDTSTVTRRPTVLAPSPSLLFWSLRNDFSPFHCVWEFPRSGSNKRRSSFHAGMSFWVIDKERLGGRWLGILGGGGEIVAQAEDLEKCVYIPYYIFTHIQICLYSTYAYI